MGLFRGEGRLLEYRRLLERIRYISNSYEEILLKFLGENTLRGELYFFFFIPSISVNFLSLSFLTGTVILFQEWLDILDETFNNQSLSDLFPLCSSLLSCKFL